MLGIDLLLLSALVFFLLLSDLSHDRIGMITGEIVELTGDEDLLPGIYVWNSRTDMCRLEDGLDSLNEKFSGNYEIGDQVWMLYSYSPKLMKPRQAHPIFVIKRSSHPIDETPPQE